MKTSINNFDTEDELVQYFLHQLCKNNDQIILDRPHELGNVIAGLNQVFQLLLCSIVHIYPVPVMV